MRQSTRWQDVINLLVGLWLIISPWAVSYSGDERAMANAVIFGIIVAVLSVAALTAFQEWEEWINALIGIWLIISPWVLGFSGDNAAMQNLVVAGIIVLVLSVWSSFESHRGITT